MGQTCSYNRWWWFSVFFFLSILRTLKQKNVLLLFGLQYRHKSISNKLVFKWKQQRKHIFISGRNHNNNKNQKHSNNHTRNFDNLMYIFFPLTYSWCLHLFLCNNLNTLFFISLHFILFLSADYKYVKKYCLHKNCANCEQSLMEFEKTNIFECYLFCND